MGTVVATDYLFPTPSPLSGAGAIFNLSGGYFIYNTYQTGEQADAAAIRRDWWKTAEDFKVAIEVSKKQYLSEQSR